MRFLLAAALTLTTAGTALAQTGGTATPDAHAADHAAMVMADGEGVVKSVDAKAGTVTLQHAPIPALKWPAMTMPFKASPPSILQSVKVGQAVRFKLMQMNGATTVTAIQAK
ncbi:copper-binding protein [Phenylobacterium aquaticum]|uniref:copper-binding protein n=1 Tax=Phenylobacterium aquaticum TaxID=1763816 RepID=UPI001F5D2DF0|nr:copper-binding protein [Phenylobacterium aquaticum]MCI3132802.1 copper-binding protein [Phenylobacterium aquaticum]